MEARREFWVFRSGFGVQPARAAGFEQVEGAHNVGVDEIAGTGDGAIHMRFGGEVQDMRYGVLLDDTKNSALVAQVHFLECIFGMAGDSVEIRQVAGVGKGVEVHQPRDLGAANDVVDEV